MNRWQSVALGAGAYREWLTREGSLTRALQARCDDFSVECVRQVFHDANPDEHAPLGLACGELSWIREVVLHCAGRNVVFAHTVVPATSLRGPWRKLTSLGNRPLGAALFADPRIERHPLAFRRINGHHPLYRQAAARLNDLPGTLWARRSSFSLDDRPILVTEVFLPWVLAL